MMSESGELRRVGGEVVPIVLVFTSVLVLGGVVAIVLDFLLGDLPAAVGMWTVYIVGFWKIHKRFAE